MCWWYSGSYLTSEPVHPFLNDVMDFLVEDVSSIVLQFIGFDGAFLQWQCHRVAWDCFSSLDKSFALVRSNGTVDDLSKAMFTCLDDTSHVFMKTMSTFRDEREEFLCKYIQGNSNSSEICVLLAPFFSILGNFRINFTRKCSSCQAVSSVEQSFSDVSLLPKLKARASPVHLNANPVLHAPFASASVASNYREPLLSELLAASLTNLTPSWRRCAKAGDQSPMFCPSCGSQEAGLHGQKPDKTVVSKEFTSCSPYLFFTLYPGLEKPPGKGFKTITPILETQIRLPCLSSVVDKLFLDAIVLWPGQGHFTCIKYFNNGHSKGYYFYDGMKGYFDALATKSIPANAIFLGESLKNARKYLKFEEMAAVSFSRTEQGPPEQVPTWSAFNDVQPLRMPPGGPLVIDDDDEDLPKSGSPCVVADATKIVDASLPCSLEPPSGDIFSPPKDVTACHSAATAAAVSAALPTNASSRQRQVGRNQLADWLSTARAKKETQNNVSVKKASQAASAVASQPLRGRSKRALVRNPCVSYTQY
jgi:hypothetical protein